MIPLAMCVPGDYVEIEEIRGRRLRARLMAMGIGEGMRVRVLQGHGLGIILAANNTRVAIGRGAAHKVLVRPLALYETEAVSHFQ